MVGFHDKHVRQQIPPVVAAGWLHHAFTQIHPFQDGNGRVARALASIVLIRSGYFPLVVSRDERALYIENLEAADRGQLDMLVSYFAKLQKKALTKAISRVADLRPAATLQEALNMTRDLLVSVGRAIHEEHLIAKDLADALVAQASASLDNVANKLRGDISTVDARYQFSSNTRFAVAPIRELRLAAQQLSYEPNPTPYHHSLVLQLHFGEAQSLIVISFHGAGPAFHGLLVAVAYFQTAVGDPVTLNGRGVSV